MTGSNGTDKKFVIPLLLLEKWINEPSGVLPFDHEESNEGLPLSPLKSVATKYPMF